MSKGYGIRSNLCSCKYLLTLKSVVQFIECKCWIYHLMEWGEPSIWIKEIIIKKYCLFFDSGRWYLTPALCTPSMMKVSPDSICFSEQRKLFEWSILAYDTITRCSPKRTNVEEAGIFVTVIATTDHMDMMSNYPLWRHVSDNILWC